MDLQKVGLALKKNGPVYLLNYCYQQDANMYRKVKDQEGQLSYIYYTKEVRSLVNSCFYELLPGHKVKVAPRISLKSLKSDKSSPTLLILNNDSQMAHFTVLLSMSGLLNSSLAQRKLLVINLFSTSYNAYSLWLLKLRENGFTVIDIKEKNPYLKLRKAYKALRPRQFLWWGWPPGQWLGPLQFPDAIHRSISFKYDFPLSERFSSHHISYGQKYADKIQGNCPTFGFFQPFDVSCIPNVDPEKLYKFKEAAYINSSKHPLGTRKVINIGSLGRSEKIAQHDFLKCISQIMKNDKRIIYHWTGKNKSDVVCTHFKREGLEHRHKFHGWVDPFKFLKNLDIYADTFPFGTGEMLIIASFMGLPIVMLDSPYEANLSHMLIKKSKNLVCKYNKTEYIYQILNIARNNTDNKKFDSSSIFSDSFSPNRPNPGLVNFDL